MTASLFDRLEPDEAIRLGLLLSLAAAAITRDVTSGRLRALTYAPLTADLDALSAALPGYARIEEAP